MSSISTNILAECVRKRVSRRDLAERIGMSYEALSRRLRGRTKWSIIELEEVARTLSVQLMELIDGPKR